MPLLYNHYPVTVDQRVSVLNCHHPAAASSLSPAVVQVRLLDVTRPDRIKTLDTYQLPEGAGAHVVKFDKNTWTAAVATYLLDIPGKRDMGPDALQPCFVGCCLGFRELFAVCRRLP